MTESFAVQTGRPLALPQHGRRVEPRGAPCGHPHSQHTHGNQDSGRTRERHRITRLNLEKQGRDEPCGPPTASQAERQSRRDKGAKAMEDEAYYTGRLRAEGHAQPDFRPTRVHRLNHDDKIKFV